MTDWKKGVFFSDTHAPFHLPQTIALLTAFLKVYKPDLVIWGGDIIDAYTASTFAKVGRTFNSLKDELTICRDEVVDPVFASCSKAKHIALEGNHEFRIPRRIADRAPEFEDLLKFEEWMGYAQNGIRYIRGRGATANGIYKVNEKLTFMHGKIFRVNTAKFIAERWGEGAIIQGHAHRKESHALRKGSGRHIEGYVSPCMCKPADFGDGMDTYQRGFMTFGYKGDKNYTTPVHNDIIGKEWTEMYTPSLGDFHAKWITKGTTRKWVASQG